MNISSYAAAGVQTFDADVFIGNVRGVGDRRIAGATEAPEFCPEIEGFIMFDVADEVAAGPTLPASAFDI